MGINLFVCHCWSSPACSHRMGPYIQKHFHLTLLHSMVMEWGVDAEIERSMLRGPGHRCLHWYWFSHVSTHPHYTLTAQYTLTTQSRPTITSSRRPTTHELLITQINPFITTLMCTYNVSLTHIPPHVTRPCRNWTREITCREPWCWSFESNEQTLETSVITVASAVSNYPFAVTCHCGMCQMREENEVSPLHSHP